MEVPAALLKLSKMLGSAWEVALTFLSCRHRSRAKGESDEDLSGRRYSAAICRTISSMASFTSGETSVPCSKSSSLASDLVSMMLPEIDRASRSRWRKSGSPQVPPSCDTGFILDRLFGFRSRMSSPDSSLVPMVFAGYTRSHATLASDIQIYMFSSGMRISQCPRRGGTGGYSKDRRITGREISAPLWQMWQTVN